MAPTADMLAIEDGSTDQPDDDMSSAADEGDDDDAFALSQDSVLSVKGEPEPGELEPVVHVEVAASPASRPEPMQQGLESEYLEPAVKRDLQLVWVALQPDTVPITEAREAWKRIQEARDEFLGSINDMPGWLALQAASEADLLGAISLAVDDMNNRK